jgi:enoyl-CoA hydratase/carnithine racemase
LVETVQVDIDHGVAEVRLNRPDKLNALDLALFHALVDTGARLARTPGLRAVLLCGNGRTFSVGIDLGALSVGGDAFAQLAGRTHGECNFFQWAVMLWRHLPVPVIAAIHGHALGGGLQLALGADIRVVAPDAQLSVRELAWGLIPDMAGTVLLRKILRDDILRDLVFTGRVITGQEAFDLGLASRLADDPVAAGRSLARELAGLSPDAMRAAKRLANQGAAGAVDDDMLLAEAHEQQALLKSDNHREALTAYAEKRPARYRD